MYLIDVFEQYIKQFFFCFFNKKITKNLQNIRKKSIAKRKQTSLQEIYIILISKQITYAIFEILLQKNLIKIRIKYFSELKMLKFYQVNPILQ